MRFGVPQYLRLRKQTIYFKPFLSDSGETEMQITKAPFFGVSNADLASHFEVSFCGVHEDAGIIILLTFESLGKDQYTDTWLKDRMNTLGLGAYQVIRVQGKKEGQMLTLSVCGNDRSQLNEDCWQLQRLIFRNPKLSEDLEITLSNLRTLRETIHEVLDHS